MENETIETVDSSNDTPAEESVDALKEKLQTTEEANRKLFARAKKAEGFTEKDGEWVKAEPKAKTPESKTKTDDKLLEKLDKFILRSEGIKGEEEIELFNSWKERTGMEADEIVADDIFLAKLEKVRTDKANEVATSDVKGGKGTSDAKNTPEYWVAKGVSPTPEQVPDLKLRAKIVRARMANEGSSKKFYND